MRYGCSGKTVDNQITSLFFLSSSDMEWVASDDTFIMPCWLPQGHHSEVGMHDLPMITKTSLFEVSRGFRVLYFHLFTRSQPPSLWLVTINVVLCYFPEDVGRLYIRRIKGLMDHCHGLKSRPLGECTIVELPSDPLLKSRVTLAEKCNLIQKINTWCFGFH